MSQRFKCYAAVIHSKRRYSYEAALAIIRTKPKDSIERMLHDAHKLAQKIRRHRFKEGALELDFPETKIRLDEKGHSCKILN
jgi:ribonuclease R